MFKKRKKKKNMTGVIIKANFQFILRPNFCVNVICFRSEERPPLSPLRSAVSSTLSRYCSLFFFFLTMQI